MQSITIVKTDYQNSPPPTVMFFCFLISSLKPFHSFELVDQAPFHIPVSFVPFHSIYIKLKKRNVIQNNLPYGFLTFISCKCFPCWSNSAISMTVKAKNKKKFIFKIWKYFFVYHDLSLTHCSQCQALKILFLEIRFNFLISTFFFTYVSTRTNWIFSKTMTQNLPKVFFCDWWQVFHIPRFSYTTRHVPVLKY